MDRLSLKIEKNSEGFENVHLYINGENLIELIKRIELEYDASIAGDYQGLPPAFVFSPSNHFFGKAQEELDYLEDKTVILLCECGIAGCWDFNVKIVFPDNTVTWSDFEQPHRGPKSAGGHWQYSSLGPFVFDRKQYESVFKK
ncbi:hypothetical protein [Fredinandcohnia sp. 179-A 10B2 NHS]|uniref:hypothetical protein n=1 Tax=Fredinandcohnia sp. 179-A 10B2 NHS TaxID=3235176 RepID=UPI0039A31DAD